MRSKHFYVDGKPPPDRTGNCHGVEELVLEIIGVQHFGKRQKATMDELTPYTADFSLIWVDATRRRV